MKLVGRIVSFFFLSISILVALVFAFIELRALFAGDFLLMNLVGAALIGYLMRGAFFLLIAGYSICLIIALAKSDNVSVSHYFVAPAILIASLFSIFFYSQYIYFLVIFIALIPCAVVLLRRPSIN